MSRVFLDTNLLAYQFDRSEPEKREAALDAVRGADHSFIVSTQVLLELYVVLTRKLRPPLPHDEASDAIDALARLPVVSADDFLVRRAVATVAAHQLSVWDAMIIEAAAQAGCEEVWTEDLAAGSTIRGVSVVNPLEN